MSIIEAIVSTQVERITREHWPEVSRHFPPMVRDSLWLAARIDDNELRIAAIERAIEQARRMYPEMFRAEPESPA